MMIVRKALWTLRGLLEKPFFRDSGFPVCLGKPLSISKKKNITLGNNVRIYPNARIETLAGGGVVIGDNVAIAQNFHCTSAGELEIGDGTLITENVCITNIDHCYEQPGVPVLEQEIRVSRTSIGPNCFIGFGAVIQAGTVLGKQCIVGANAVVRGEYPDYSVIVGVPGRVVKRFNAEKGVWERVTPP